MLAVEATRAQNNAEDDRAALRTTPGAQFDHKIPPSTENLA